MKIKSIIIVLLISISFTNWNTNYNVGDYYWKIKLEK